MPDISSGSFDVKESPLINYYITYFANRSNNTTMYYQFTIRIKLPNSSPHLESGTALTGTMTVNGVSKTNSIKASYATWQGGSERSVTMDLYCPSTVGNALQPCTFEVVSSGETVTKAGVIRIDDNRTVTSKPLNPTPPTNPTSLSITPAPVFESSKGGATFAWSGAQPGFSNPISGYQLYISTSPDNAKWTETDFSLGNVNTYKYSGSSMTRGDYLRFRLVTKGSSSDSSISAYSNVVRHNTLPTGISEVSVSPTSHSHKTVTLYWLYAITGLSPIDRFEVQIATLRNGAPQSDWGPWRDHYSFQADKDMKNAKVPVPQIVGDRTKFRVRIVDTLGAQSAYREFPQIVCVVGACLPPTTVSVNSAIAENPVTLSWSGAEDAAGNSIVGYDVEYSEAATTSSWGAWTAYASTTYNSMLVSPPDTSGYYRRFRVRTRGSAGEAYYSDWKISGNTLRKNIPPSAPTVFTALPAVYSEGEVTLAWSGAAAGTSPIKIYVIQIAESSDNVKWDAYKELATVTTSASSGTYVYTPDSMSQYMRYRVRVGDTLDGYSGYFVSTIVRRRLPPDAPKVVAPTEGSITYNTQPRFLIQTQTDHEGASQVIQVITAGGQNQNSEDHTANFSKSGKLQNGEKTIYKHEVIPFGKATVTINSRSGIAESDDVARIFTVSQPPFSLLAANKTTVQAAHMLSLRNAVNTMRNYYGMAAFVWASDILAGKTEIKDWNTHIHEVRSAIDAAIERINDFDPNGKFRAPRVDWLPLGGGRPRVDVMSQIQEIIAQL